MLAVSRVRMPVKPSSVVTSRVAASWGMILSMSLVPLSRVTVSVCSLVSLSV